MRERETVRERERERHRERETETDIGPLMTLRVCITGWGVIPYSHRFRLCPVAEAAAKGCAIVFR